MFEFTKELAKTLGHSTNPDKSHQQHYMKEKVIKIPTYVTAMLSLTTRIYVIMSRSFCRICPRYWRSQRQLKTLKISVIKLRWNMKIYFKTLLKW